jgi:hypothetical protein
VAALTVVPVAAMAPVMPPAIRTRPLETMFAVWACTALPIAVVSVHVLVPFHSSAEASGKAVVDAEPPATRTCPFERIVDESSVAV